MSIASTIESLLFVSAKPLSKKKLAVLAHTGESEVEEALRELEARYREGKSGLALVRSGSEVQLMTAGENAPVVQEFLKDEMTGELSRPSLETLTVIAYRGPVTKAEIEQIRGVNCSLILRNLLIRGLVEAEEDTRAMVTRYRVSLEFLRYLGVQSVEELPDHAALSRDRTLEELLMRAKNPEVSDSDPAQP